MKEQILSVSFDKHPVVKDRVIDFDGTEETKKEKKEFPFKLHCDVIVTVETSLRKFSFKILAKYIWNGADIPRALWMLVGSRTDNAFLIASMVHDYMLQFKKYIMEDVLNGALSIAEYRRLTSLIFREVLKHTGTSTIKANIMSGCVDIYQMCFNKKQWSRT